LNCPNCKNETQGIKLNGKIFCNFCGEAIKDQAEILEEAYQQMPIQVPQMNAQLDQNPEPSGSLNLPPEAKRISGLPIKEDASINLMKPDVMVEKEIIEAEPNATSPQTLQVNPAPVVPNIEFEKEIKELEAEEEILDLIEELPTPKEPEIEEVVFENQPIIKQNRNRAGMVVVKGEPDPITLPELEAPEEIQLESHYEEEVKDTKQEDSLEQPVNDFELAPQEIEPQSEINKTEADNQVQPEELMIDNVEVNIEDNSTSDEEITIPINPVTETVDDNNPEIEINQSESETESFPLETEAVEPVDKVDDDFFKERIDQAIEDPEKLNLEIPEKKSLLPEGLQFVHTADDDLKPEEDEKKPKKKQKEPKIKKPKNKNLLPTNFKKPLIVTTVILFFVSGLIGLVLYVNNYAIKEENIATRIEAAPAFEYSQPNYLPPGYTLSYESSSGKNYIEYKYNKFDRTETIIFRATSVNANLDVFEDYVKKGGSTYKSTIVSDTNVWIVEDKKIYFKVSNVLYEVTSSAKIPESEAMKIAEGVID
jgi:hypothetical protein